MKVKYRWQRLLTIIRCYQKAPIKESALLDIMGPLYMIRVAFDFTI